MLAACATFYLLLCYWMDARQASHVLLPLVCKDMQSQFLDLFLVKSRFIASLKSYQLLNLPADCARDQFKS